MHEFENEISASVQAGMDPTNIIDGLIDQIIDCLENNGQPNTYQNTETQNSFNLNSLAEMIQQELNLQTIGASTPGPGSGGPGGVSPSAKVLFGMDIFYFEGNGDLEAPSQYNGNISWMKWRNAGEQYIHKYGFTYDSVNRLTKATYKSKDLIECDELPPNAFQVLVHQYDEIGNIDTLSRSGFTGLDGSGNPEFGLIDQLSYDYDVTGVSKLQTVTETADPSKGFGNSTTYGYDGVGNLTSDLGKGITSITYNYLNLPEKISFREGSINFIYDANGRKLRQWIENSAGNVVTQRHYCDGIEFVDNELETIYHEEGRIVYKGLLPIVDGVLDTFKEFYLKDHLGNVRVRFADKNGDQSIQIVPDNYKLNEITATYNYYPFGMQWDIDFMDPQGLSNHYRYNTKEYVEDFGLKLNDYGARWYDAAIGRFTTIDPLADKMPKWSTFSYTFNNPMIYTDPTGMSPEWYPDPDDNSKLVAEKNDNWKTLSHNWAVSDDEAKQLTQDLKKDGNGNVVAGETVSPNNKFTQAIKNTSFNGVFNTIFGERTNCHGSTKTGTNPFDIRISGIVESIPEINGYIDQNYSQSSPSEAIPGKTIIRWGGKSNFSKGDNITNHTAIFYGKSKNGTHYAFTVNGNGAAPKIMRVNSISTTSRNYGKVKGIIGGSGYYNPK